MVFQISINDFYPRSPCGERRERRKGYHPPLQFLSTLSLRRATGARLAEKISKCISIHALLAESDPIRSCCSALALIFLSTLSLRRATILGNPCAGCPAISIHALLAESDCITTQGCCQITHFYPRSPCGERLLDAPPNSKKANFYPRSPCGERLSTPTFSAPPERFLSTLSLRRATAGGVTGGRCKDHFYPRSPCGERPPARPRSQALPDFYPRSPCGERPGLFRGFMPSLRFLSTLSLRRAT